MIISLLAAAAAAIAMPAEAPQVRFCPSGGVWTYPLDDQRRLRSLVAQSFAITNQAAPDLRSRSIS